LKDKREKRNRRQAYQPKVPFKTVEGVGTEVFKRLSPHSVWVLLCFYEKFTGFNRADLSLTYAEVENTMSGVLFTRAIWQLIGFGFLDVRRFGKLEANCSLFALSDRWRGLTDNPKRLDAIQAVLDEVERLKRQPGNIEKRIRIRQLRNSLFKI
jgi:hypothetical protein